MQAARHDDDDDDDVRQKRRFLSGYSRVSVFTFVDLSNNLMLNSLNHFEINCFN